ncbi:MAG: SUF system NifU family Fe-S cluster assembly protein [Thermaerobacter sp.]|nr:SUF system NifU family Fe-S cluster assembly protein [Bacillota bacterium]REJ37375.1 MAG: SUF system NifU family Fe-S cluster assembly protein [Bacillota bacterium]
MTADMYREYILQHYRSPRNYGRLENPDIVHEDDNPLCGDQVHIEVALDDQDRVADIRFQGKGCAISQASTSILTDKVKGKTLEEIKALTKDDVFQWLRIPISPMRVKCAVLGLMVLQAGIHHYEARRGR